MRLSLLAACTALLSAVTAIAADLDISQAHRLLEHNCDQPNSIPIGSDLTGLAFRDLENKTYRIGEGRTVACVFLSTSCPLAKRYTQRLNRMAREFAADGASIVGVFPNHEDEFETIVRHAVATKFTFPVVRDSNAYLAGRLGAEMTPQVVVCDGDGLLRYRGAIDDNRYENRVNQRYMHGALAAVRDRRPIQDTETKCLGCSIHQKNASEISQVTYTQHIARIVQDNCQGCHRQGQVAPFSLSTYEEVKTWATEVNAYAQSRLMPPWKAAPNFGSFKHIRRLTDEQLVLIDRWVQGGTVEGPKAELPPNPKFNDQWVLGKPDLILEMTEEYTVAAEGEDDYRHFIIPTNFEEPKFVRATDVIPGNRQSVHHVLVFVDTSGKARELDEADPGPGYTRFGDVGFEPASGLGGWAPGSQPAETPTATGFWLPPGGDVVLQVHYYRTGVEEKDRTKVGLYFSDHPNPVPMRMGIAINHDFKIRPGEKRYKVEALWTVEEPVYAIAVAPHMHLLGKEMKVTATLPGGKVKPLIWIPDWDFNWQGAYEFQSPLLFPAGTKVEVVAYFDNSTGNPNNPNSPPKPVGWGEKTTDEMCIAFLSYVNASKWHPPGFGPAAQLVADR